MHTYVLLCSKCAVAEVKRVIYEDSPMVSLMNLNPESEGFVQCLIKINVSWERKSLKIELLSKNA